MSADEVITGLLLTGWVALMLARRGGTARGVNRA